MYSSKSFSDDACHQANPEYKDKSTPKNNATSVLVSPLKQIAKYISEHKTQEARTLLRNAISEDMENAEIYNLLGISYEIDGNSLKASKFYRVAYYMDQTFKAASDNLERVCRFPYYGNSQDISWGIEKTEGKK